MGSPVLGKDKLVYIGDGGDPETLIDVPHQGDATFNTGVTAEISVQKNSKLPYSNEAGASITFSIRKERPALAPHTRLAALAASGEQVACEYRDKNTGGEKHAGQVVVTLGEETTGVEGLLEQQVTLSFVGDPVRGVTA